MDILKGIDLFSGIGGIGKALEPWVRTVAYCEIEPYCQSILLQRMQEGNLSKAPIWDDIRTLPCNELPPIDIIFGGFPCQDLSCAGAGKGLEGERSGLFFEILRIIDETLSPFVFLENVPAIRTRGAETVCKELAKRGYDCRWCCLSAADVGAVHKRERWFLLAHDKNKGCNRQRGSTIRSETSFSLSSLRCEDATNANSVRELQQEGQQQTQRQRISDRGKNDCNTWRVNTRKYWPFESRDDWQKTIGEVCRVDDGVSHRVVRLKCLGNSVVPIQVREAFKILLGLSNIKESYKNKKGE